MHVAFWFGAIEAGEQITLTDEIAEESLTVTFAVPDLLESCVDVAVMVAVPAPDGAKRPDDVIVPLVAVHVTGTLDAPLPKVEAEHWLDWPV